MLRLIIDHGIKIIRKIFKHYIALIPIFQKNSADPFSYVLMKDNKQRIFPFHVYNAIHTEDGFNVVPVCFHRFGHSKRIYQE